MLQKIILLIGFFSFFSSSLMAVEEKATTLTPYQQTLQEANKYWAEKKHDKAIEKYQSAIKVNADKKQAYIYLATLYLSLNKLPQAVEYYQEAITRDPNNAKLFISLGIAYLHQGAYQKANLMTKQALKLEPTLENAQKLKKYIQLKQEVLAKAKKSETMPADHAHKPLKNHSSVAPVEPEVSKQ